MKSFIPTPEVIAREAVRVLIVAIVIAIVVNHTPGLKKLLDNDGVGGVL